ncbi:MAG: hypothetical protein H7318_16670 [Oligoflexus sp.]|nr:hypothetical protein [Oligoflexus sp.]
MKHYKSDIEVQRVETVARQTGKKVRFFPTATRVAVGILIASLACTGACHKKHKSGGSAALAVGSDSGDAVSTGAKLDQPPKVDAGPLRNANAEIFIDAQSSNAVKWEWEQLAGPGTLNFQSPETEDTAVSADRDGFYWLRLTVTGADGTQAFDDVQLLWDTVAPCPVLPNEVKTFQAMTIDGHLPSDVSSVEWTQVSGPGTLAFSAPKTGMTSIAADLDGSYVVRLTAADKVGNSCAADMTFIWETTVPTVAIGQDINTNKEVLINAASIDAKSFSWSKVSGPGSIVFSAANQEDTRVSASQDGSYVLRLTITTDSGVTAFDEVNFTWDTTAPTLELGQDLNSRYRATIDASSSGAVVYAWKKISGPGKVLFSSQDSEDTAMIVDKAGSYEIALNVTDQAGNSTQDSVHIFFDYDVRVFAKQVASGGSHSCAVLDDSSVACWGYNYAQELGYGDNNKFGEGTDRYMPPSFPINLGAGKKATMVAVNYAHSCAILEDNSIKCWGQNASGQLGYGDTIRRGTPAATSINLGLGRTAKSLSAGFAHTCAILDDNSVKCWGANSAGQLGYGDYQNRLLPPVVSIDLGGQRSAQSLSLGAYHTCALLDDSTVKCWGNNANGQLGYGDRLIRSAPARDAINLGQDLKALEVNSGAYHTCAVIAGGALKCWGRNKQGQLGYGDIVDRLAPDSSFVDIGTRNVLSVSGGLSHTCVMMDDSNVQCWGGNEEGQLGYGDLTNRLLPPQTAINFGNGRVIKSLSAGRLHSCVILDDSTLKCWGSNSYGQLGGGKIVDGKTPPPSVVGYGG